jgi:ribosomal protein S12 methylthiotransferase
VIIDREDEDFYIGRTEFDSPEVDPEVLISKDLALKNGEMYDVKITDSQPFELYGKVIN